MNDPFERWELDGTDQSLFRLSIVDKLYLRRVKNHVGLRLVSPQGEGTRDQTVQQWGLTRDQAEFLLKSLQEILKDIDGRDG